jgi:hypothetical protein
MIVRLAPEAASAVGGLATWQWLVGALGAVTVGGLFGARRQAREKQSRQGGRLLLNLRNRSRL